MNIQIRHEPLSRLAEHAGLPISFQVERVLDPVPDCGPRSGWTLQERLVKVPYLKNYDAISGNSPVDWPRKFDMSHWGLLAARVDARLVGGAVVAFRTDGVDLLKGRTDIVALWDLRVAPDIRRRGVGSALFAAVERWAVVRGCCQLKVETQNINVPACRFYAAQGCELRSIERLAYPELPGEIQFVWCKDLDGGN